MMLDFTQEYMLSMSNFKCICVCVHVDKIRYSGQILWNFQIFCQ